MATYLPLGSHLFDSDHTLWVTISDMFSETKTPTNELFNVHRALEARIIYAGAFVLLKDHDTSLADLKLRVMIRRLQRAWHRAINHPEHKMCRGRLMIMFANLLNQPR